MTYAEARKCAEESLKKINDEAETQNSGKLWKAPKDWPQTPKGMRSYLDRKRGALRNLGIDMTVKENQRFGAYKSATVLTMSKVKEAAASVPATPKNGNNGHASYHNAAQFANELMELV